MLLGLACFVYTQATLPFDGPTLAACVACVAIGALLGIAPFIMDYRAQVRLAESDGLAGTVDQIRGLQTIAAAVASATGKWQGVHEQASNAVDSARQAEPADPVAQAPVRNDLMLASRIASSDYESAIAQLERVLDVGREKLDTATVRKVEEKLALIDKAIDDARQALATDPSNAYLNRYLAGTMRRKLDLLRRTAALTEL